jgi:hypothetical protein
VVSFTSRSLYLIRKRHQYSPYRFITLTHTTIKYFCETKESLQSPITNHQVAKSYKTQVILATSVPDAVLKMSVGSSTMTAINYAILYCQTTPVRLRTGNEGKDAVRGLASRRNLRIRLKLPQKITTYSAATNRAFEITRVALETKLRYTFFALLHCH